MECISSDSFLFHTEVVLHLSFHSLFAKFNMHESNVIFCKTSDFPHLILQLELDCSFGRVFCYLTSTRGMVLNIFLKTF